MREGAAVSLAMPPAPELSPPWLRPLVDRVDELPGAYKRRIPRPLLAALNAAATATSVSGKRRDAAVLVLFSGGESGQAPALPDDADLLLTVRASSLRHHAGQAAFPGGVTDPGDDGPVATALREATEETGLDTARLHTLAVLETMFIPPSGYHVAPVLAYSPDPGPVEVVDPLETAIVARVPVRAFVNPENRLMVYRRGATRRAAGPAFLLNQMLVWGFTGHVIAGMLDVAGWTRPWDSDRVMELDDALALVGGED
ncbi:NUDIX hydrolase [Mycolicibacterium brumae]|uniref:CoA pyrophosphatase n=1 Tax=Mycolicibacterium brumae TaxID=85968 RepID=A0A2G5P8T9_9MYCO|nr:CoA pyrophosphatase [Mycolicibacterium brumae]MCV7193352.1 CoA pyrophosphatase [Mycolicibacterium brumae]PIB74762.1 CoA pyrophosphatase [Mycolicibacterium brumae]UWW07280.1 CoA pyrophosphatase [Mycolicibacterium brumae]